MDRSDELKNQRSGDILGIGDVVGSDHNAPHTSHDPEAERKRRARMQEGADDVTPESHEPPRRSGATGIDMGSGGEGTDIER